MLASMLYRKRRLLIHLPTAMAALVTIAYAWMQWPIAPARVVMTTGQEDGVYFANAQRYAKVFAGYGVELVILPSAGSSQNIDRLQDPNNPADLAFVQGGFGLLGNRFESALQSQIQTIANVDIEPVWIFTSQPTIDHITQLRGLRLSIGPEGSGSRRAALDLLSQGGLQAKDITVVAKSGLQAATALQNGEIDAMIFVSSPLAPTVRALVAAPGVQLAQFKHNAALAERMPYLELRLLAKGSIDEKAKHPSKDHTVLTATASLVARQSLPAEIKRLAAAVAMQVHASAGPLNLAGEFPSFRRVDFATAYEAREVLARGLPWLASVFPFWWAQFITRLLLIVLPITLTCWLVSRWIPRLLLMKMQEQVTGWYGELKYIEHDMHQSKLGGKDLSVFYTRLQEMDKVLARFNTPPELMARFFTLRQHVDFVTHGLLRLRGR
jgi:uncharacterized protein